MKIQKFSYMKRIEINQISLLQKSVMEACHREVSLGNRIKVIRQGRISLETTGKANQ